MTKQLIAGVLAVTCAMPAFAGRGVEWISLQSVLDMPDAKVKLDGSVRFFLAGAPTPPIEQTFGEGASTDRASSVGGTDTEACQLAALTVLTIFQNHAKEKGANAVIDMVSYFKKQTSGSPTDIECRDGILVSGVALKGTYARIAP